MGERQIAETPAVEKPESETDEASRVEDEHLVDVDDGCGCAEVWEHLSENRGDE